jgi:hypothetical protein
MTEILSTLLMKFVLLLFGLMVPVLDPREPVASEPVAAVALAASPATVDAEATPHCAPAPECDAARMRWQVTLASPALRRCGGCARG